MKGAQLLFSSAASVLFALKGGYAFSSTSVLRCSYHLGTRTVLPLSSSPTDQAGESANDKEHHNQRRNLLQNAAFVGLSTLVAGVTANPSPSWAEESIYAPKFVQEYEDFQGKPEGFSVRDVTVGKGESPQIGDRVVYDWSGYTIGYFGRPFEAKGGPQGGAFDKEIDYARTVLGSGNVVKGLELAMLDMKPGGVRQVLVPYGDLGYPADDGGHERVGPKPTTFSGLRALNFVLDNPRVDRTLLFNVKLVRVDKPNGKGGFNRG